MALHRDIHWIGRQWAVTGHGMQLIDQKLQGFFDIEAVRLWDESHIEAMRAKEWLNVADFDKGLAVARARYPLQPQATGQFGPVAAEQVPPATPPPEAPASSVEAAQGKLSWLRMRVDGRAKFIRPWRVWMKRQT